MQRKIKKPKPGDPKLLKEFIKKMLPLEQAIWKKVAGPAGAKIYQFIKWKRGMMDNNGRHNYLGFIKQNREKH